MPVVFTAVMNCPSKEGSLSRIAWYILSFVNILVSFCSKVEGCISLHNRKIDNYFLCRGISGLPSKLQFPAGIVAWPFYCNFTVNLLYMKPVITLTFSPCIDKSSSVPSLIPEKKLHCAKPVLEPGGGGVNVSRVLMRFGTDTAALYPEGSYSGKFFTQMLMAEKIPVITVPAVNPTRENLVVLETSSQKQYRFGMPATELLEQEWEALLQKVKEMEGMEYLVASGSLPEGMPDNIFGTLSGICRTKGVRLVIDASGPSLKAALKEGVFMAKPNLGELAALTGKDTLDDAQVYSIARELVHEGACEVIVVSMGSGGAIIADQKQIFRGVAPVVRSVSTVGAGDSMVAGIVHALRREYNLQKALAFGIACGTAATLRPGTDLCRKQDVDRILPDVIIFPVS